MARQGSLRRPVIQARFQWRVSHCRCAVRLIQLFVVAALTFAYEPSFAADTTTDVDARVELTFENDQPRLWNIRLSIVESSADSLAQGEISEVQNHCTSTASTAALQVSDNGRTLSFQPRAKMSAGSLQFRVRTSREAKLAISFDQDSDANLDSTSAVASGATRISLSELLAGQTLTAADTPSGENQQDEKQQDPSWSLKRITGDGLRVDFAKPSTIVPRDSQFSFSVHCNSLVSLASRSLVLRYELYRVSHGKVVAEKNWPLKVDANGNSEPIVINEIAPPDVGVYEVRCSIQRDDDIWSRLRRRDDPPLAFVGRPIIVPPNGEWKESIAAAKPWKTVGEIRPSQTAAWSVSQWLPANTNRLIAGSDPPHDLAKDKHAGEDISLIQSGGGFQATVPVTIPGFAHQVTLRYPAGRSMRMRVDVAGVDAMDDPKISFLLVDDKTNDRSGDWATHTFVHYPRRDDQIRLTNLSTVEPVAFESITVQAGPLLLATSAKPLDHQRIAALQLTDFDWVDSLSHDTLSNGSVASCQRETIALYRMWIAAGRLSDYVLASGMNAVSVPAVSKGRAWFSCDSFQALRSQGPLDPISLNALLTLLDDSDLKVFLSVDTSTPLTAVEDLIRRTPGLAEQVVRVDRSTGGLPLSPYNGLHPIVRDALAELVAEVNGEAEGHSCYAGINLQIGRSSHVPAMGDKAIHDSTLALFASSVVSDAISPVQLRRWVAEEGQSAFEEWKTGQTRQLHETLTNRLADTPLLLQTELLTDIAVKESKIVGSRTNLLAVRNVCRVPVGSLSRRISFEQSLSVAELSSAKTGGVEVVSLCDSMPTGMPASPVVRDRTASDICRLVDRYDPAVLLIQSTTVTGGLSPAVAQALSAFRSLPNQKMAIVDSSDPAAQVIQVRSARDDDHLLLSITNHAPWSSQIEVDCSSEVQWQLADQSDLSQHPECTVNHGGTRTSVVLPGGKWILLKSKEPAPSASIKSWASRAHGGREALDHIKRDVSAIAARLGILSDLRSYPALSNGGFEQQGGVGLVGWLHAQHPPDSVRVDEKESVEGQRSVLLTTDARVSNRTWMVSETFTPPESGRLAVSLACRGELGSGDQAHRLRVSIEGTRGGEPLRQSSEFEIPRDGKWQSRKVILEVDGIEPSAVESLRLTIDSLSAGRVWIDDVHLHDWFPLAKERSELQSQAFLAVQGLQRGNLTPSARLRQNHWAQFLLTEGASRQPPEVIDTTETQEEPPGVAERLRSWLPRPLRF